MSTRMRVRRVFPLLSSLVGCLLSVKAVASLEDSGAAQTAIVEFGNSQLLCPKDNNSDKKSFTEPHVQTESKNKFGMHSLGLHMATPGAARAVTTFPVEEWAPHRRRCGILK